MADEQAQNYQPEQTGMYELEFPAPQLASSDGRGPVLIHALEGFSDAGHAIRLAAEHLRNTLDTELVASFAIDELLDYRSRRPLMTFKTDHFTHYEDPQLNLYALHDSLGTPFLLLAGLEPDLRWERFVTAVRVLAERLGVRQTIGLGTIPMAVPHTRPLGVTMHATRPELMSGQGSVFGRVQVPGSVAALLEFRMGEQGRDAIGFAVHVPHYLSQAEYPTAAITALESITRNTGLVFPMESLREAARRTTVEIEEQISASAELSSAISGLEQQYDAFAGGAERENLIAEATPMPTGDELAAQFERFLAERDDE